MIDCFFLPKFQIGVMTWCLLELFNKIIGAYNFIVVLI